jgi:hypothetical protein
MNHMQALLDRQADDPTIKWAVDHIANLAKQLADTQLRLKMSEDTQKQTHDRAATLHDTLRDALDSLECYLYE